MQGEEEDRCPRDASLLSLHPETFLHLSLSRPLHPETFLHLGFEADRRLHFLHLALSLACLACRRRARSPLLL
jgi:hypothetical protein